MSPTEGKALVLRNMEQAIADGAFGLPWFVCTNKEGEKERFWGVDHLGQLAIFLGLEKPNQVLGWRAVL